MLAGSETVDVVIRTGAIVGERSVSPYRDFVGLPRFGVGQQEFRKDGVVAPVLQLVALPFSELDSKKPLPIVEAEAVRLVRSGQFHPGRRNSDVFRPCRPSAAHVPFRFDAHPHPLWTSVLIAPCDPDRAASRSIRDSCSPQTPRSRRALRVSARTASGCNARSRTMLS